LKKYRAADSESRRQPFEAEGEVFLRRLSGAAAERVRLQIAMKWPNGVLDIRQNERALRDFTLSVLAVCVYSQPNLAVPYFANLEEAAEWVDALDPELQQLAFAWREAAVKLNPLLLPPATILSTIPEPRTPEDEAEDAAHLAELLKDVPSRSISEAAETPVEEAPATV
jgi:hypothetical protein